MRPQSALLRVLPALALAACNGDGTGANRLAPAQVQGVYSVCTLRFQPLQAALPAANVLATVIDTSPPAPKQPPSLTLSGQDAKYQLIYTRRSDSFLQQLTGGELFGVTWVNLDLPDEDQSDAVRETLLPTSLVLDFDAATHRLTAAANSYSVRRADYARAAAISEEGLQDRISGTLTAVFSSGGC